MIDGTSCCLQTLVEKQKAGRCSSGARRGSPPCLYSVLKEEWVVNTDVQGVEEEEARWRCCFQEGFVRLAVLIGNQQSLKPETSQ